MKAEPEIFLFLNKFQDLVCVPCPVGNNLLGTGGELKEGLFFVLRQDDILAQNSFNF